MSATSIRAIDMNRRINDHIAESTDPGRRDELLAFYCECGDEECYVPVWLTAAEYRRRRHESSRSLLAHAA